MVQQGLGDRFIHAEIVEEAAPYLSEPEYGRGLDLIERIVAEAIDVEYDLRSLAAEITERHADLQSEHRELETSLTAVWTNLPEDERQLTQLRSRYESAQDELKSVRGSLVRVERDLSHLDDTIEADGEYEGRTLQALVDLDGDLKTIGSRLDTVSESVESTERWLTHPSTRLETHETDIDDLTDRIQKLDSRVQRLEEDVDVPIPRSSSEIQGTFDELSRDLGEVKTDFVELQTRIAGEWSWFDLNPEHTTGSDRLAQLEGRAEQLEKQAADITATLHDIEGQLEAPTWHATRLEARLKGLQDRHDRISEKLPSTPPSPHIRSGSARERFEEVKAELDQTEAAVGTFAGAASSNSVDVSIKTAEAIDSELDSIASAFDVLDRRIEADPTGKVAADASPAQYSPSAPESLMEKLPGRVKVGPDDAYAQHISNVTLDLSTAFNILSVATGSSMAPDEIFIGSVVTALFGAVYQRSKTPLREEDGFVCWVAHESGAAQAPVSVDVLEERVDAMRSEIAERIAIDELSLEASIARLERLGIFQVSSDEDETSVRLNMAVQSSWQ